MSKTLRTVSILIMLAVLSAFSSLYVSAESTADKTDDNSCVESDEETDEEEVSEQAKDNLWNVGPNESAGILEDLKRYYSSYQINSSGTIGHFGSSNVTLASVLGVGANDIASYLDSNLHTGKLLGTPYSDYNWTPGVGMDCSGFVTYTICACKTGYVDQNIKTNLINILKSDAHTNVLDSGWTYSIASNYYNLLCSKKVECYVYLDGSLTGKDGLSSTARLLADGKMEKGDIILYLYCGLKNEYYPSGKDNHIGIYYGSYGGYRNTFWQSAVPLPNNTVLAGNASGNRITSVPTPCCASTAILIKCGHTRVSAPTDVNAQTLTEGGVKVTWYCSSADSYQIYRSTTQSGSFKKIGTSSSESYTDTSAKLGVTYYYKVIAISSGKKSAYSVVSNAVARKIGTVSRLTVNYSSLSKTITLTWDAVFGVKTYVVTKYDANGAVISTKKLKGTTYKDTSVKYGKSYKYSVKTVTSAQKYGDAVYTAYIQAKVGVPVLTAEHVKGSGLCCNLKWSCVGKVNGYQIYMSTSAKGKYVKRLRLSGSTYQCVIRKLKSGKLLTAGTTYYFKIRAYVKSGNSIVYSKFSAAKSVKVKDDGDIDIG